MLKHFFSPFFHALSRYAFVGLTILACLGAVGCATPPHSNYNRPLSQEVFARIQVGMSSSDVRQILGSPTLVDIYHPRQWVYLLVSEDETAPKPWQAMIILDDNGRVQKVESRMANNPVR